MTAYLRTSPYLQNQERPQQALQLSSLPAKPKAQRFSTAHITVVLSCTLMIRDAKEKRSNVCGPIM